MASNGKIGVVTVTYNSAPVLPEFFDSLAKQIDTEFVIYIIDNASSDRTVMQCHERTDLPIQLIANDTNKGVAEGNNQGIRAALGAGCESVLLINNDTVFGGDLLAGLRAGLHQYQCEMITPKIVYNDNPETIWAAGGYFQWWLGYRPQHYGEDMEDRGQFDVVKTISYAPTCCVLIRRSVFERIGLMDPLYFVYMDDVDFMLRARRSAIVMKYIPRCILRHKVSALTGGPVSNFTVKYCTRNRIYFLRKNLPPLFARIWAALYRLYCYSRLLFRLDSPPVWEIKKEALAEGARMGSNERSRA